MDQIKRLWLALSLLQKISIGVSAIAMAAALMWLSSWRHESSFKPLYRGLDNESAAAAVEKLKEAGIEYRLADDGSSILVPAEALNETRLSMAREGVLRSGRIGFELFDQTTFGTTDFAEQVNYRRALEGELERTISTLGEIERARVHLTFAKDSVFTESRQPAKASILLNLRKFREISQENVTSIANLVASAVEGLNPGQVTIVDSKGNLLNKPRADVRAGISPDGQIEYRAAVERDLQGKLAATLDPVLGFGNYRTGVAVDVDFSQREESEELWDPNNSVMATSQRTEETASSSYSGGVPGTQSSLPDGAPRLASGPAGTTRRTENTTYQTSKRVRHTSGHEGEIKRLTVAVLLDQTARWEGSGKQKNLVLTPPPPERVEAIRNLVTNVVGLNQQRGDQLTVDTMPFNGTLNQEPPEDTSAPKTATPDLMSLLKDPKIWGSAAGAGGLLIAGGTFLLLRSRKKKKKAAALAAANAIEAATGATPRPGQELLSPAEMAQLENDLLASLESGPRGISKSETLAKYLRQEVKKDPRAAADLLRHWLLDGGA